MSDLVFVGLKVNPGLLDAELHEALPFTITGVSTDHERNAVVIGITDGQDAAALRDRVAAVLAAHDPAKLAPQQIEEQAVKAARTALSGADFARWKADVQAAASLAALRPLLLQLGRVVWMLAKAGGLTNQKDPDA